MPDLLDSERQLLGGLLNWPEYIARAEGIEAASFVGPHHAALWEALAALDRERRLGKGGAFLTVWQRIQADGHAHRFAQLGNEAYLAGLSTSIANPARLPDLIRVVVGEASRRKLALAAEETPASDDDEPSEHPTTSPSGKPKSQAAAMLALFEAHQGEAFRSLDDRPLVCLTEGRRRQTMQLPQAVKALCRWQFEQTGQAATARSREEVKNHLEALAETGPKRQTWLRVAEHDGALYLDLGDETWRVVRIASEGWEVIDRPPVYFVRSGGMLPLPVPVRGGSVAELFDLINVPDTDGQALVLGWLVSTLRPSRPMPLLALHAEQGSAKSTTARMLAEVIDPHQAGLRIRPKDEETVSVATHNAWVVAYDNLSTIPPWLSDLLCCLSTGASYTARTKYSDAGEHVMRAQRPVLLTSIEDIASRSDLLDRMIVLTLPTIPEARRRTEQEVLAAFNIAHPRILGALLDAAAHALRTLPDVKPGPLPRMADFALWATAAEHALGLAPGGFLTAYRENRQDAHGQALDACPVVEPLEHFMSGVSEWTGTATELLAELDRKSEETKRSHPKWPKDGTRLSGQLRRIAPNLRSRGLDVRHSKESTGQRRKLVTLAKVRP